MKIDAWNKHHFREYKDQEYSTGEIMQRYNSCQSAANITSLKIANGFRFLIGFHRGKYDHKTACDKKEINTHPAHGEPVPSNALKGKVLPGDMINHMVNYDCKGRKASENIDHRVMIRLSSGI